MIYAAAAFFVVALFALLKSRAVQATLISHDERKQLDKARFDNLTGVN